MVRLTQISRDQVAEQHRGAFDEVAAAPGGIGSGPTSILKNSPELAKRAMHLSDYLRNESSLPKKVQELAMLTAARSMDCQYIWNAHAASGRREGLSDALVDALRDKQPLPALAADEAAVLNLGMEFFQTHKVSQANFQAVLDQFGRQGFAELTALMGYYAMLSFNANAVVLDLPSEMTEPVLPI
ncbi:MAG: carboxymuconolactone decarboxylase family protein [Chloroflexi bacterium]|nr:carboxymuconolactone decarboxylase family protein [Chloroflexota bacterium]